MPSRSKVDTTRNRSALPRVTPTAVDNVKARCLSVVNTHMDKVHQVLEGNRKWSNQQIKLFQICLDKVVGAPASQHKHEHTHRKIEDMSREELMRIARGDDLIEGDYEDVTDAEPIDPELDAAAADAMDCSTK